MCAVVRSKSHRIFNWAFMIPPESQPSSCLTREYPICLRVKSPQKNPLSHCKQESPQTNAITVEPSKSIHHVKICKISGWF